MGVEGVLFDSGGVLIGPRGGRWNPRFDFEEILARERPDVAAAALPDAIAAGQRLLDGCATTPPYADYHRAILRALGIAEPTAALLHALKAPPAQPAVLAYPDARPVLERLRDDGIRLAVVSDAWAGLPDLHASLGLDGFFSAYAISEVVGCNKPDPRMYRTASDALGLAPADCLFVDDDPQLVRAAVDLGYRGVALLRGDDRPATDVPWIATLDQLLPLVR